MVMGKFIGKLPPNEYHLQYLWENDEETNNLWLTEKTSNAYYYHTSIFASTTRELVTFVPTSIRTMYESKNEIKPVNIEINCMIRCT